RRQHVALLPFAKRENVLVVGRTFDAAIPGAIVGIAVLVVLAVCFIVFVVVARPVVQREAVVGGDEVHAGPAAAPLAIEHIGGSEQARREQRGRCFAAPVVADGIAKLVAPFGPAGREAADLIAARTAIPGLGDQLHRCEQRVLIHRFEKAALLVEAINFARQDS